MKKVFKILGIIFLVFIALIILLPIIFKDDIKKAVDKAIAEQMDAEVYYDPDGFSLSLLPDFPHFTFGLADFGIVGKALFSGDTLLQVNNFELIIDLMSVIQGEAVIVNAITLRQPQIYVKVLADGKANYSITKPSVKTDTTKADDAGSTQFSVRIKGWTINNGRLVYDDRSLKTFLEMKGLNHSGSGDFTQDIFDLTTQTEADAVTLSYEGVEYVYRKPLDMRVDLSMDLPHSKYTFKNNTIRLSDLVLQVEGDVEMPQEDIAMDLSVRGKDISIQGLLSLMPGVYQKYLNGLETSGEIQLSSRIKGVYNDKTLPDITTDLSIAQGRVKYAEYPVPMEALQLQSSLHIPGEDMDAMRFDMPNFSMQLEGEEMTANLHFENLKNYTWRFGFQGSVDLEKLLKVMGIDTLTLSGKVKAQLKTEGNMALVNAKQYDQMPTEGEVQVHDLYFQSKDLPQGFGIKSSQLTLSPTKIVLEQFDATVGKSDMRMTGALSNFIGYALRDNEVLSGNLDVNSNTFDLNEWMSGDEENPPAKEKKEEEGEAQPAAAGTTTMKTIRLPKNIDFAMKTKINTILYNNMTIENLNGLITLKEGAAALNWVDFNTLGGSITMNGHYDSAPKKPWYDFGFSIQNLSIPQAFKTFNTVKKIAPVAKNMSGNFSASFGLAGSLKKGMTPDDDDMNGKGIISLAKASIQDNKIMKAVSALTQFNQDTLKLKDIEAAFQIRDGRVYVDPFDVHWGGYQATISGSNGFDGDIDYVASTQVPTGAAGEAINSLTSSYTGGRNIVGSTIPVNINITGTYAMPKVSLVQRSAKEKKTSVAQAAKQSVKTELEKQKKIAGEKAKAALEEAKRKAEEQVKEKANELLKGLFGK